ncbi:diadenylate cyclase CdaA [Alicyclobacillus sp. SO9]|uniref:diadenylate cyclase CdaA n=1 Tax=Alicyclobacillus sp. SO9 TaxID=2665646 RepID=UPI0018E88F5B|nr:diadenylate cyclase CdaA [Alicyclobacillus sp. SO9]QQE78491.1 TIGR00159 family protein [Alicyclobacillus sp. SO9]
MATWLNVFHKFDVMNVVDILLVAFVIYRVLLLIRGTRAVQLLKGIIVILLAKGISRFFHLTAMNFLINNILTVGLVAIPVVFQPELRRALEQLGRGGFFSLSFTTADDGQLRYMTAEVVKATQVLSKNQIGALLVIERNTGLSEYVETGTDIDGKVSSELLINTFIPNTPLHDGAVVIRGDKLLAAGCFLPLTDSRDLDKQFGTRHRAAIGVTEQSDSVAVVVSEETGHVSLAVDGVLTKDLNESALRELLESLLTPKKSNNFPFFGRKADSKNG